MQHQGAQGALNGAGTPYPINGHAIVQPAPATQAVGTLAAMLAARRWLVRQGKVPSYANGARRGTTDTDEDRAQLVTHAEAVAAVAGPLAGQGYALGFALGPDGRGGCWQGIDLDDVEANGLADLANSLPGYVEVSPSGKGAHAIGYGTEFSSMPNESGIEAYSKGRFFTFTGHAVKDAALCDLAPFVSAQLLPLRKPSPVAALPASSASIVIDSKTRADIENALAYCDPNAHKSWTDQGQRLKKLGDVGREIWLKWAEGSPKFKHWENLNTWNSFDGSKTSHVAIFKEAQANGWSNPGYVLDLPPVDTSALDQKWRQRNAAPSSIIQLASISDEEWANSRVTPDPIVHNFLYPDVQIYVGAGGEGKTTLTVYECINIVLRLDLYGRSVRKPGKVVIVSAEDSRERIIATIVLIARAMHLSAAHVEHLKQSIIVLYVGGADFRLCIVSNDVVANSPFVEQLIEAIRPHAPSLVVFDPAISFGVGESRVNDGEQGLIRAGRRFRDALGCAVRFIHHTGKQNARDGAVDQYAGRGGSAMADGARMVVVVRRLDDAAWLAATGETLPEGSGGLMLALPKLSYAVAQPHIYVERTGFAFRHVMPVSFTAADKQSAVDERIVEFLRSEEAQGRFHSNQSLEQSESLEVSRTKIRAAIHRLEVAQRITFTSIPGRGQSRRIRVVDYSPASTPADAPLPQQAGLS